MTDIQLKMTRVSVQTDLELRWQEIEQRMLAVTHLLWSQGSICSKSERGGEVWRLRYYERVEGGRLVQRTIRIGREPELVERAQDLLRRCKARREWLREIPQLCRQVSAAAVFMR